MKKGQTHCSWTKQINRSKRVQEKTEKQLQTQRLSGSYTQGSHKKKKHKTRRYTKYIFYKGATTEHEAYPVRVPWSKLNFHLQVYISWE